MTSVSSGLRDFLVALYKLDALTSILLLYVEIRLVLLVLSNAFVGHAGRKHENTLSLHFNFDLEYDRTEF